MDKLHTVLYDSSLAIVEQDTSTIEGYSSLQNYYRAIAPFNTEYIPYVIFYPTNSDNNVGVPAEYLLMENIDTTTVDGSTYYVYETAMPPAVTGSARANKIEVTVAFIVKDDELIGVSRYDENEAGYNDTTYIAAQLLIDYDSAVSGNYVRVFNTETDWSFDGSVWTDTDDITITDLIELRADTATYTLRKGVSTSRPTHSPNNTESIIAILNTKISSTVVYDEFYTKVDSELRYVNVTGDTMTGDLTVPNLITAEGDVDTNLALKVDKVTGSSLVTDVEIAHLEALDTQAQLDAKFDLQVSISTKGQANGVAPLNASGVIDAIYVPGAYDDYEEYATYSALPATGVEGLLYVVLADETQGGNTSTYRWTGSTYTLISNELSASEVKALYESNSNTNAYTDTEKTKLGTIETGAQVNDIEVIKINSVSQPITSKVVDLDIPVNTSDLNNDGNGTFPFITSNDITGGGDMLKLQYDTDSNGVVDKAEISLQNLIIELTYDTAGKFYATVAGATITENYEMELLFPNTTTDLTTAVSVSLDGVAGTYKSLKYDDTLNAVVVSHIAQAKVNAYYNGTELMMKGNPLINQDFTFNESINSTFGNGKAINGISSFSNLKGLSLNQIVQGDLPTDIAEWIQLNSINTSGTDVLINTGTGNTVQAYTYQDLGQTLTTGNEYYIKTRVRITNAFTPELQILIRNASNNAFIDKPTLQSSAVENQWYELSAIYTVDSSDNGVSFRLGIGHQYTTTGDATGAVMEVDYIMVIPITNTPLASKTAAELDLIVPLYFEGTQDIVNPTIQSVGVNLLDKNDLLFNDYFFNKNTGLEQASTGFNVSNKIYVIGGESYVLSGITQGYTFSNAGWGWFDSNDNYIGGYSGTLYQTMPSNAYYVKVTVHNDDLDTFQLEQGTTATTYAPHKTTTQTYNDTFRSVGSIQDELNIVNDNYIKTQYVGYDYNDVVQSATTWDNDQDGTLTTRFLKDLTSLLDYVYPTANTVAGNFTLKINGVNYPLLPSADTLLPLDTQACALTSAGKLVIRELKTNATNSSTFEAYLQANDVEFIYELASGSEVDTVVQVDGTLIQESVTTFIQGNDNFATEFTVGINMNVDALVSSLVEKNITMQKEIDDLTDITKIAFKRWQVSLTPTTQGALSKPDYDYTDLGLLFPNNDATEIAYIQSPAPTDWVAGTTIYPNVIVRQEADQQAVFKIDYKMVMPNTAIPTAWTTYTMETYKYTYSSGSVLNVLNGGDGIDTTGATNQAFLLIKLYRDDAVYTGDMLAYDFFIKYQAQGFGLTEE